MVRFGRTLRDLHIWVSIGIKRSFVIKGRVTLTFLHYHFSLFVCHSRGGGDPPIVIPVLLSGIVHLAKCTIPPKQWIPAFAGMTRPLLVIPAKAGIHFNKKGAKRMLAPREEYD